MKKVLPIFIACIASAVSVWGQYINPAVTTIETEDGKVVRCFTTEKIEEARTLDPNIAQRRAKVERRIAQFEEKERNNANSEGRNMPPVYVIPVVVHVVYRTAAQNVSDARVFQQIQVLNNDYRRTNADAGNTPSPFDVVAADTEIEFCLATKDPMGNPTTGINRISTTVTNIGNGNNYYSTAGGGQDIWDPTKYLNLWVCAIGGGILGYTYTPGNAPTGADGVVIDYQYFGISGTSAPYNGGRTATHEVGHWLNLEHIWGPTNSSCSQDDGVTDTPMQQTSNGGCPTHPSPSCTNAGDMFMNYMDYVNDNCMNAFTAGQKTRMRNAINASRPGLLTSQGCLSAPDDAGVYEINYPIGTICATSFTPQVTIKNFGANALVSATINYRIDGGTTFTQAWTGNLATTQTDLVTLPQLVSTLGAHTFEAWATLPNGGTDGDATNDGTTTPFTISGGGLPLPYSQGFEGVTFPPTGWTINNPDGLVTWARTTTAAKTGTASMFMDNWNYGPTGPIDQAIMPSLDMSNSASVTMTFQLAYALYSASGYSDTLRIWASNDCGVTWTQVYEKYDAALTTVTQLFTSEFVPTANQWRMETIDLSAFGTSSDVTIRFDHITDYENNLHIDDINITSVPLLGVTALQPKGSLNVYPNPTNGLLNIDVKLPSANDVEIMIYNSLGQLVSQVLDTNILAGNYKLNMADMAKGVYHIQVVGGGESMTQKVILQ